MKSKYEHCGKRMISFITAGIMLCSLTQVGVFSQSDPEKNVTEFYVSPEGNDSGKGTADDPFATIAAARDAVRAAKEGFSGDIVVYLREGRYYQENTLEFTAEDSGSDDCTITYKAYGGETAVISGAVTLDTNKFSRPADNDPFASRIKDETARAKVLVYDLSGLGIDYTEEHPAVYYDGNRALEARYPNDGYVLGFDDVYEGHDGPEYKYDSSSHTFYDKSHVVGTWANPVGVKVIGMFEIDWSTSDGTISSYDSETNRVGLSTKYWVNPSSGRYYYANIIEEMDMVGEYYIDVDSQKLYFYAPDDYSDMHMSIANCKDTVIKAEVNNYTFDGLTIEGGYDDNIRIVGNNNCIKNSKVRCCGDVCLSVNGMRNTVYNNEVSHSGGCAVSVYGGDTLMLIPSNTLIDNNKIHDFGEIHRVYNGALYAEGIGFKISNNEIYEGPHTCFTNIANDMLFENNYIHNVCYEAADAGAIYEGGWGSDGNIYRNNLIKDIVNDMSPYYCPVGYYVDNSGGGKTFVSNMLINIDGYAILCSGRDNNISDNIIVGSDFYYDQRTYYPGSGVLAGWALSAKFPDGDLWKNLIPWNYSSDIRIDQTPAYATTSWAVRYPWTMLMKTTNVVDLNDNYVPYAWGGAAIRNNVICGSGVYRLSDNVTRLINFRDNINAFLPENLFMSYEDGDYTVKEDSKIYKALPGFRAFDFSKVGVMSED